MKRIVVLAILAFAGCAAETDTKLGTQGETCFVDEDCRIEFVCDDGACSDGTDGSNNGANNSPANNGPANNGNVGPTCGDVCNYLSECVGEDEFPECEEECVRDTGDWSMGERDDSFRCILGMSCAEILRGDTQRCVGAANNGKPTERGGR